VRNPDGFRPRSMRVGPRVGAADTGMTVYQEWLLVLEGRPTLRHPGGEDALEPWDVVFFPSGGSAG